MLTSTEGEMMPDLQPVYLSLQIAAASLLLTAILGIPAAYVMVRSHFLGKAALEALFTLPLVLPPVVTGFALLLLIGKQGPLGRLLSETLHTQIIFTPYAAILAGTVVAFPLMYQSVKSAFQNVDPHLEDAARTLGASEWRVFYSITLPLSGHGLISGAILSFSRALGEFGATIMVAGNIPGKTQTLPLAIYFAAESNDLTTAGIYVLLISVITFSMIYWLNSWLKNRHTSAAGKGGPYADR
jgi:molybdate transport system permease protein